ncbi:hypothetical protein BDV93DRAFT_515966 [Ceratobasidium sp. AG-I]|nr:hypothetical protein BDV93DRAFT_515966 [Ceratobasidium sp. AG-I]
MNQTAKVVHCLEGSTNSTRRFGRVVQRLPLPTWEQDKAEDELYRDTLAKRDPKKLGGYTVPLRPSRRLYKSAERLFLFGSLWSTCQGTGDMSKIHVASNYWGTGDDAKVVMKVLAIGSLLAKCLVWQVSAISEYDFNLPALTRLVVTVKRSGDEWNVWCGK